MPFAGVDTGSSIAKAVIMDDNRILSYATIRTHPDSAKTAREVVEQALDGTGLAVEDMDYIVATGYGRVLVPFAHETISEITCHAKGANWHFPSGRTVIDMGGEDWKAISCDERGNVVRFVMNDKCAGGTGRFLAIMANLLGIPLERLGEVSLEASRPWVFCNQCVVYLKQEALSVLRKGVPKADILAGIHDALVMRVVEGSKRGVTIQKDIVLAGGQSKNSAIVAGIGAATGLEPLVPEEPLIVGAVGAAVLAAERFRKKGNSRAETTSN